MTVPLRAALYLRVSTARQAEHDVSIPDQKRQGEAWCASRGYELVETFVEPGATATNDRRPEFQRMIEAGTSKAAPFDVVIVHSFRRFTETDQRLNCLFDAIESGVADLDTPGLKERIAGLKAIREQASANAERAQAALDHAGNQAVSPDMVKTFARAAHQRIRLENGGYRRDHLRALAQRVEVADKEVLIMGSKSELLRTLVAAPGGRPGVAGVQSSVLKWRAAPGEDENYICAMALS
jgi:hypothetical protein